MASLGTTSASPPSDAFTAEGRPSSSSSEEDLSEPLSSSALLGGGRGLRTMFWKKALDQPPSCLTSTRPSTMNFVCGSPSTKSPHS
eukprot:scaffold3154_cov145-Ochromonas_danica.AAC.2